MSKENLTSNIQTLLSEVKFISLVNLQSDTTIFPTYIHNIRDSFNIKNSDGTNVLLQKSFYHENDEDTMSEQLFPYCFSEIIDKAMLSSLRQSIPLSNSQKLAFFYLFRKNKILENYSYFEILEIIDLFEYRFLSAKQDEEGQEFFLQVGEVAKDSFSPRTGTEEWSRGSHPQEGEHSSLCEPSLVLVLQGECSVVRSFHVSKAEEMESRPSSASHFKRRASVFYVQPASDKIIKTKPLSTLSICGEKNLFQKDQDDFLLRPLPLEGGREQGGFIQRLTEITENEGSKREVDINDGAEGLQTPPAGGRGGESERVPGIYEEESRIGKNGEKGREIEVLLIRKSRFEALVEKWKKREESKKTLQELLEKKSKEELTSSEIFRMIEEMKSVALLSNQLPDHYLHSILTNAVLRRVPANTVLYTERESTVGLEFALSGEWARCIQIPDIVTECLLESNKTSRTELSSVGRRGEESFSHDDVGSVRSQMTTEKGSMRDALGRGGERKVEEGRGEERRGEELKKSILLKVRDQIMSATEKRNQMKNDKRLDSNKFRSIFFPDLRDYFLVTTENCQLNFSRHSWMIRPWSKNDLHVRYVALTDMTIIAFGNVTLPLLATPVSHLKKSETRERGRGREGAGRQGRSEEKDKEEKAGEERKQEIGKMLLLRGETTGRNATVKEKETFEKKINEMETYMTTSYFFSQCIFDNRIWMQKKKNLLSSRLSLHSVSTWRAASPSSPQNLHLTSNSFVNLISSPLQSSPVAAPSNCQDPNSTIGMMMEREKAQFETQKVLFARLCLRFFLLEHSFSFKSIARKQFQYSIYPNFVLTRLLSRADVRTFKRCALIERERGQRCVLGNGVLLMRRRNVFFNEDTLLKRTFRSIISMILARNISFQQAFRLFFTVFKGKEEERGLLQDCHIFVSSCFLPFSATAMENQRRVGRREEGEENDERKQKRERTRRRGRSLEPDRRKRKDFRSCSEPPLGAHLDEVQRLLSITSAEEKTLTVLNKTVNDAVTVSYDHCILLNGRIVGRRHLLGETQRNIDESILSLFLSKEQLSSSLLHSFNQVQAENASPAVGSLSLCFPGTLLEQDCPRYRAEYFTLTDSVVLSLDDEYVHSSLYDEPNEEWHDYPAMSEGRDAMIVLERVPGFSELSVSDRSALAKESAQHFYSRGEVIKPKGEAFKHFLIVLSGFVEIYHQPSPPPSSSLLSLISSPPAHSQSIPSHIANAYQGDYFNEEFFTDYSQWVKKLPFNFSLSSDTIQLIKQKQQEEIELVAGDDTEILSIAVTATNEEETVQPVDVLSNTLHDVILPILQRASALRTANDVTHLMRILDSLSATGGLSADLKALLGRNVTMKSLSKGEVLFRQGELSEAMYVVLTGSVGVFLKSSVDRSHRNVISTIRDLVKAFPEEERAEVEEWSGIKRGEDKRGDVRRGDKSPRSPLGRGSASIISSDGLMTPRGLEILSEIDSASEEGGKDFALSPISSPRVNFERTPLIAERLWEKASKRAVEDGEKSVEAVIRALSGIILAQTGTVLSRDVVEKKTEGLSLEALEAVRVELERQINVQRNTCQVVLDSCERQRRTMIDYGKGHWEDRASKADVRSGSEKTRNKGPSPLYSDLRLPLKEVIKRQVYQENWRNLEKKIGDNQNWLAELARRQEVLRKIICEISSSRVKTGVSYVPSLSLGSTLTPLTLALGPLKDEVEEKNERAGEIETSKRGQGLDKGRTSSRGDRSERREIELKVEGEQGGRGGDSSRREMLSPSSRNNEDRGKEEIFSPEERVKRLFYAVRGSACVATANVGKAIGEKGLLHKEPRAATIAALQNETVLLRIDTDIFKKVFLESAHREQIAKEKFLMTYLLGSSISSSQVTALSYYFEKVTLEKGAELVREDGFCDGIYLQIDGSVERRIHERPLLCLHKEVHKQPLKKESRHHGSLAFTNSGTLTPSEQRHVRSPFPLEILVPSSLEEKVEDLQKEDRLSYLTLLAQQKKQESAHKHYSYCSFESFREECHKVYNKLRPTPSFPYQTHHQLFQTFRNRMKTPISISVGNRGSFYGGVSSLQSTSLSSSTTPLSPTSVRSSLMSMGEVFTCQVTSSTASFWCIRKKNINSVILGKEVMGNLLERLQWQWMRDMGQLHRLVIDEAILGRSALIKILYGKEDGEGVYPYQLYLDERVRREEVRNETRRDEGKGSWEKEAPKEGKRVQKKQEEGMENTQIMYKCELDRSNVFFHELIPFGKGVLFKFIFKQVESYLSDEMVNEMLQECDWRVLMQFIFHLYGFLLQTGGDVYGERNIDFGSTGASEGKEIKEGREAKESVGKKEGKRAKEDREKGEGRDAREGRERRGFNTVGIALREGMKLQVPNGKEGREGVSAGRRRQLQKLYHWLLFLSRFFDENFQVIPSQTTVRGLTLRNQEKMHFFDTLQTSAEIMSPRRKREEERGEDRKRNEKYSSQRRFSRVKRETNEVIVQGDTDHMRKESLEEREKERKKEGFNGVIRDILFGRTQVLSPTQLTTLQNIRNSPFLRNKYEVILNDPRLCKCLSTSASLFYEPEFYSSALNSLAFFDGLEISAAPNSPSILMGKFPAPKPSLTDEEKAHKSHKVTDNKSGQNRPEIMHQSLEMKETIEKNDFWFNFHVDNETSFRMYQQNHISITTDESTEHSNTKMRHDWLLHQYQVEANSRKADIGLSAHEQKNPSTFVLDTMTEEEVLSCLQSYHQQKMESKKKNSLRIPHRDNRGFELQNHIISGSLAKFVIHNRKSSKFNSLLSQ